MRQRAFALGASAGAHISTFHSLCVRILRRYADRAGINASFSVYDQADQRRCVKQAVKALELDTQNFPPARMLDAISALKNKLTDPVSLKSGAYDFFSKTLGSVYEQYQKLLNERNGVDFDDLLMKTAVLLRDCPDVCSELGDRFKFVLIDEYQDTNYAQYAIAKLLVSQHNNICVTGDPDQSIYRWRGADIRNIMDFESDWPDAIVVKLEENFRSTPNILTVADKLISFNLNRKLKTLIPTKSEGEDISLRAYEDESEEAEGVTGQIEELAEQGACLNDVAVFYRVNAQSRALEEALFRAQIPYQVVRGIEFYRRKEIRDLLAYLKILVNPSDEIALLRIVNTPKRGIGKTTMDRVRSYARRASISLFEAVTRSDRIEAISKGAKSKLSAFANMIAQFRKDVAGPVAPLAERVFAESGLAESLAAAGAEGETATENVNELVNSAADYDKQTEEPSLIDYLQQVSLFSDADAYDPDSESVKLMTLHAAKGLEFAIVFIVGVEEGLLPHERSNAAVDEEELEEERRLFFVGITRAISRLFISHARYRTIRGQENRTIPSQFLFELGDDVVEQTEDDDDDCDGCEQDSIVADVPEFAPGQLVRHDSFGLGRIEKFVDMGANSVVSVRFSSGQTKTLMLKFANLSRVDV
jgi:DNA helicase-2/ATP-dependent DNA helicase PcrA